MRGKRLFYLACLAFAAALRLLPAFAEWTLKYIQLPLTRAIACLTSRVPIPFWLILALLCALLLIGKRTGVLAILLAAYLLLRFPAVCAPKAEIQTALVEAIDALCENLIDALNASPLAFPDQESALQLASDAVSDYTGESIGNHAVKLAPAKIMNRLRLAGIYVPFTAEALVNPDLPVEALPFTAIHELTHRLGIADEAQANLLAFKISVSSEGALADSARLWTLRYAMARMRECDASLWKNRIRQMQPETRAAFDRMGGSAVLNDDRYSRVIDLLFSPECDTIQPREGAK